MPSAAGSAGRGKNGRQEGKMTEPKFPIRLDVIKPLELANGKRRRIEDASERRVAKLFSEDGPYCLNIGENGHQLWALTTKGRSGRAYGSREATAIKETDPGYAAILQKAARVEMRDVDARFRAKGSEHQLYYQIKDTVHTTLDETLQEATTSVHDTDRARELGRELAEQSGEIIELQETLHGQRRRAAKDQQKIQELEESCREADARCAASQSRLSELKRMRDADTEGAARMRAELAQLRQRVHELESSSARDEVLRHSMETERARHAETMAVLEKDLRDREAEVNELRQEVGCVESERTSAKETERLVSSLRAKLSDSEQARSDLADKEQLTAARVAGLEADLASAGSGYTEKLRVAREELAEVRRCSEETISSLRDELAEARRRGLDAGELGDELERMRSELSGARQCIDTQEGETAMERERHSVEAEAMRGTITELQGALASAQAAGEEHRTLAQAQADKANDEHEARISELHSTLLACQQEVERARAQDVTELLCYILVRCKQAQQCAARLYLLR